MVRVLGQGYEYHTGEGAWSRIRVSHYHTGEGAWSRI